VTRIAVIFAASALIGYAKLNVAVGELIAMVAEGDDTIVGIPAAVYLAACWQLDVDERDLLRALVMGADRTVEILPLLGPDTVPAAGLDADLGRHGVGQAVVETLRHSATLATFDPDIVGRTLAEDSVLDLGLQRPAGQHDGAARGRARDVVKR
jgi:hypothetical protein